MARLRELDALRGGAAFSVVVHHNLAASDFSTGKLLFISPLQLLATGRPAVLLFFVLSGFVLARSLRASEGNMTAGRWAAWALQRAIRLHVPVAAALILSCVLYALFYRGSWLGESAWLQNSLWGAAPTPASFAKQAMLLDPVYRYQLDNVLWSLAHEVRISMLLPAVAAFAVFRGRRSAVAVLALGLAAYGLAANPWGGQLMLEPGLIGSLRSSIYFVLPFAIGVALDRVELEQEHAGWLERTAVLIAALLLARTNEDLGEYLASAILMWLALQPGRFRQVLRIRGLQWLGRISFSLYLTHPLVLASVFHALHAVIGPTGLACLSVALSLPVAHLFFVTAEQPAHFLARTVWARLGREGPAPVRA